MMDNEKSNMPSSVSKAPNSDGKGNSSHTSVPKAPPVPNRTPVRTPPPRRPIPPAVTANQKPKGGTIYPPVGASLPGSNRAQAPSGGRPVQSGASSPRAAAPGTTRPMPAPGGSHMHRPPNAPSSLGSKAGRDKPQVPPTPVKQPKVKGPLITAEGCRQFAFIFLMAILIYAVISGVACGIFYGVVHTHVDWNYDITVEIDIGEPKNKTYTLTRNNVFLNEVHPYINLTEIAMSLELSSVGSDDQIKFYKTDTAGSYALFTNNSEYVTINGEEIKLPGPVYIKGGKTFIPIHFFNYYTNGLKISYDAESRVMKIIYVINEALSTPKRKVYEEFSFAVRLPQNIDELTEEDWFEYVGNFA